MSFYETISVLVSFILLLSGIIGIYIKLKLDIKALEIQMLSVDVIIKNNKKESETQRAENREDHSKLEKKIDLLFQRI